VKKAEVVVIEKTKTYHREGCPPTNMAKTKIMTIAEAKADNNRPCPGCKPDSTN
jgi:methylphosphotriester-DNA--protein-cysteine methyltransferase